jgi:nickel-dependent lactate racemase
MTSFFCAVGSETTALQDDEIREHLHNFLDTLGLREDVLLLPPDFTRFHSQSGKITEMMAEYFGFIKGKDAVDHKKNVPTLQILPALGTHAPMTQEEIKRMFGDRLAAKSPTPFLVHDWRNGVETIGYCPSEMVSKATHGMVNEPWPAQLNKIVWEKRHNKKSLVLSIGQVGKQVSNVTEKFTL